jgi:hypothetical protein
MDEVINPAKFGVDQLIDAGCVTSWKVTFPNGRPNGSYNSASATALPVINSYTMNRQMISKKSIYPECEIFWTADLSQNRPEKVHDE